MDSIEAIVARIDERTAHMEGDVAELKVKCNDTQAIVVRHGERLARIDEQTHANREDIIEIKREIKNGNCNSGLSKKQKAGIGSGIVGLITAAIIGVIEWFRHH